MGVVYATPTEEAAVTPGGNNNEIQYNDSGAFGGDVSLQRDPTTGGLLVTQSGGGESVLLTHDGTNANLSTSDGGLVVSVEGRVTVTGPNQEFEVNNGSGELIRLIAGVTGGQEINFDTGDLFIRSETGETIFQPAFGPGRVVSDGNTLAAFRLFHRNAGVDEKYIDQLYQNGLYEIVRYEDDGSTVVDTPFSILTSGAINFNKAYEFPTVDGSLDQVLVTDGAGNLTFQDQRASATTAWRYRTVTVESDPGGGNFRLDNLTIASATELYISTVSDNGVDFSNVLAALSAGDEVYFQNLSDADEAVLVTINSITDNGTWYSFGITVNDTAASATWTANETFGFTWIINASTGGTGDVIGPASSTDEAVARFDGTTGKLIQNSTVTIDDAGNITATGLTLGGSATIGGSIIVGGTVDGRDVALDGAVQDAHIADAAIHVDHTAVVLTAGAGLVGGGDISASRAFDIVAGDASITVNPNDITVGVINATQHGNQTDGGLHALATETVPGFVELATQAEVDAGTDTERVVTPDTLNNTTVFDGRYVDFTSAQTITGVKTFNPFGSGILGQEDIIIGDTTDYGLAKFGNSIVGRTAFNALSLDLDGSMLFFNEALPPTSNIEFAWADATNDIRFALAVPGPGNATYNPRSMLIAGPAVLDDEIVTVQYWRTNANIFDNIDCDTSANGADLGVQNDLEVEGIIYSDNIQESTPGAAITLTADDLGAGGGSGGPGQMTWDGNQLALFPSDITFGEGYLFGWGATGDPTTPFANRWNINSASGFSFIFSNADFPQWIVGSTEPTSSWFIDGNGNKDIRFNTLDTGFDQDNVVHFGYGGIDLQDQAGDATFIRSAATVAGTYTITLPDTDGDVDQILVNTDGAATLDWVDLPKVEYIMPLWAEENGPLAAGATEWAFGNGANTPIGQGVPLYIPAGFNAEIVAMGLAFPSGTATVQLVINGVAQGATANVTHTGPGGTTNQLGAPVPVVNGDILNFQTQTVTAATGAPAQVIAYIRVFEP